jgi:hypothetical protein
MVFGSANVWEANVAYIFTTERFSIVKMQAAGSSGTLVLPYRATNRYTPPDQTNFTLGIFQSHFSHI